MIGFKILTPLLNRTGFFWQKLLLGIFALLEMIASSIVILFSYFFHSANKSYLSVKLEYSVEAMRRSIQFSGLLNSLEMRDPYSQLLDPIVIM